MNGDFLAECGDSFGTSAETLLYCGPFVRLVFRALMRVYSRAAGKAEVCELSQ